MSFCPSTVEESTKSGLIQFSMRYFGCGILAEVWKAPSFRLVKKSRGSNRESFFELLAPCERPRLGLSRLIGVTNRRTTPLQNED